jgi:DNA (cytosine-5)-methyltransferase 1
MAMAMAKLDTIPERKVFIDLFSGCGGLALGLTKAGWNALFAIEKDPSAFETLRYNLVDTEDSSFSWPAWLPKQAHFIESLLDNHKDHLRALRGHVDLISGGPPCQGFSSAGRRNPRDPRNQLTEHYINVVEILRPRFLLLENVLGFDIPFGCDEVDIGDDSCHVTNEDSVAYSEVVRAKLESLGYQTYAGSVASFRWGVPQLRPRFIMIAVREDDDLDCEELDLLKYVEGTREDFLRRKGLPLRPISAGEAIDDLRVEGRGLVPAVDSSVAGFKQIAYECPEVLGAYLRLMREGMEASSSPNSLRLTQHRPETRARFKKIIQSCTPGRGLTPTQRARLGTSKHSISLLARDKPSATVTTLPDDIVHYSEPRILTVRENARLQSFPDWFEFKGAYTTGGKYRKQQCPRYTQVGNAVPPLLAEGIGSALGELLEQLVRGGDGQGQEQCA